MRGRAVAVAGPSQLRGLPDTRYMGLPHEPGHGFSTPFYLKLVENIGEIVFDGLVAQAQLDGNFLVRFAISEEWQDQALLWGKTGDSLCRDAQMGAGPNPMQRLLCHPRVKVTLARSNGANGPDQVIHANILEYIAMGPVLDGSHHGRILGITGEDEDPQFGRNGQQLADGFRDGGVGQFHIEQDHVRCQLLDEPHAAGDGGRFAHDGQIRFKMKESPKPPADHFMIVDEYDAGLWLFHMDVSKGSSENSAMICVPFPILDCTRNVPPSFLARASIFVSPYPREGPGS